MNTQLTREDAPAISMLLVHIWGHGWINHTPEKRDKMAIKRACDLYEKLLKEIDRRTKSERDDANQEEMLGLGALSAGPTILRTVKELQRKDLLNKSLLQQIMAKKNLPENPNIKHS